MEKDHQELITSFKEAWYSGDTDAGSLLRPFVDQGGELDEETARLFDASQIGYDRSEALNEEKAAIETAIRKKEHEKAHELLIEVLKKEPNYSYLNMLMGVNFYKWGRDEEALTYLENAVKLQPYSAGALFNLACYHADHGNKQEVMELLSQAVKFGRELFVMDYRRNIAKEPSFDVFREDPDFIEAFVSQYDNELLDDLMQRVLANDHSKFHRILSKIDSELKGIAKKETLSSEPGYDIPDEDLEEGRSNRYQMLEIKAYVYCLIIVDLDEHGEAHLPIYRFCDEKSLAEFEEGLRQVGSELAALVKEIGKETALEVGLGIDTYEEFIDELDEL